MNDILDGKQKINNITRGGNPIAVVGLIIIFVFGVLFGAVAVSLNNAVAKTSGKTCQSCHNETTHNPVPRMTLKQYKEFNRRKA
jgi:hypothetical protein